MHKYKYVGPHSAITLSIGGVPQDFMLWHGTIVDMPPDDAHVKTLVASGLLVDVPADDIAASANQPSLKG